MTKSDAAPQRLVHFTPLRYPGGKGKLAAYVKEIIRQNKLYDGEYVEPYAGGAAIGLELLFQEFVTKIHINDLSQPVYSFWKSVLHETEELCRLVKNTRLSVASWDRQKRISAPSKPHEKMKVGRPPRKKKRCSKGSASPPSAIPSNKLLSVPGLS